MASRTRFGFPTSTGDASACCNRGLRVRTDSVVTGPVQCVDNLTVRNRLVSGQHFSGTVTVTGSGSANALTESALCVQAGANFAGLTQHGQLSVVGGSCMSGPLAVSNVYGPLTVGADPAETNPALTQLTVGGDSLVQGTSTSIEVVAESGQIDELSVFEGPVGPAAGALVLGRVTSALLTVLIDTTYGTSVSVVATAVSPTQFVTTLWYPTDSSATGVTAFVVGDPYTVVASGLTSGALPIATTVTHVMPGANLALLTTDTGVGYQSVYVQVADETNDSPSPGTSVIVGYTDSLLGQTFYAAGSVADAHAQMFDSYTSVHTTLTATLGGIRGALGSPIFDYNNRLVAVVQYGTLEASYPSTSVYNNAPPGGVKGRYIRYFLNQVAASPGTTTVAIPYVALSRPILVYERAVSGLVQGGVTVVGPYSTTVTPGTQVLELATGSETTNLAVSGSNNPSFPDTVLKYSATVSSLSQVITTGGGLLSLTSGTINTPSYWTNGIPAALCINPAGAEKSTTNRIAPITPTAIEITNNTFNITLNSSVGINSFAVSTHGSEKDKETHTMVILAWGYPGAINTWFRGLDNPTIVEAWTTYYDALGTSKPNLYWAGLIGNEYVFASPGAPVASGTYTINIMKTGPAVTLTINGGAYTAAYTYKPLYDIYDYITTSVSCEQSILVAGSAMTLSTGGSSVVAITSSTAGAGQLYVV